MRARTMNQRKINPKKYKLQIDVQYHGFDFDISNDINISICSIFNSFILFGWNCCCSESR